MDADFPSVAVCAIGKSGLTESAINQWFQYYLDLGFDHAYVYIDENGWDLPFKIHDELMETIAHPIVFPITSNWRQDAYHDCYRNYRDEYDWMLFLNFGEYLVLRKHQSIKSVLCDKNYLKYEAIRVNYVTEISEELGTTLNMGYEGNYKKMYLAKSFINCRTTGMKIGDYAPMRQNGEIVQCLPNLKQVSTRGVFGNDEVDALDTSVMYLAASQLLINSLIAESI